MLTCTNSKILQESKKEQTGVPVGAQTLDCGYIFILELKNNTSVLLWMVDLDDFILLQNCTPFYQFSLCLSAVIIRMFRPATLQQILFTLFVLSTAAVMVSCCNLWTLAFINIYLQKCLVFSHES